MESWNHCVVKHLNVVSPIVTVLFAIVEQLSSSVTIPPPPPPPPTHTHTHTHTMHFSAPNLKRLQTLAHLYHSVRHVSLCSFGIDKHMSLINTQWLSDLPQLLCNYVYGDGILHTLPRRHGGVRLEPQHSQGRQLEKQGVERLSSTEVGHLSGCIC